VVSGKCVSASISSDSVADIVSLTSGLFNRLGLVCSLTSIFSILEVSLKLSKDTQYSIHEFFFACNNVCFQVSFRRSASSLFHHGVYRFFMYVNGHADL